MGNRNLQQVKQHILICNGESCLLSHGDLVSDLLNDTKTVKDKAFDSFK
jgi:hypothetical protein